MPNRTNASVESPWNSPEAVSWLAGHDNWKQTLRLVAGTLRLEAQTHPQEIRAAASMVILFCRENLWPVEDENELESTLDLAARQLVAVKQLYELKARTNPDLVSNPNYKNLLTSIDQEVRILEARMSDPKPKMPNSPPITWGKFWTAE